MLKTLLSALLGAPKSSKFDSHIFDDKNIHILPVFTPQKHLFACPVKPMRADNPAIFWAKRRFASNKSKPKNNPILL